MVQPDRQLLTLKQLQQLTGLSESTLRRRVRDGSLPVIQLGGPGAKLLFSPNVLEQLARASTTGSNPVPDEKRELGFNSTAKPVCTQSDGAISSVNTPAERPLSGPRPNWMRGTNT